jgi:hypothetical protein
MIGTGLLVFSLVVLVVVGIVCAIAYNIPFPPTLAWMRWAIPVIALIIALLVILQRMGAA